MSLSRAILVPILLAFGFGPTALAGFELLLHPQEISLDESATLRIRADGHALNGVPSLSLPAGLSVQRTSQQSIQVNRVRQMVYEYGLQASQPGTYTIGPYTINADGRNHTIGPVTLKVVPPRIHERTDIAFVTLETSSPKVFVQQPVELTLTFFSEHPVDEITLSDFNTEGLQLGEWRNVPTRDQVVNGKRYQVRRYQSTAVPMTSATFDLSPTFRLDVLVSSDQLDRNAFGMMFRRQERKTLRLQAPLVRLEVQAPPAAGRPEGYQGAVGRFTLQASAGPTDVAAGDPVTVRVQLSGRGGLRNVLPPSYPENRDLKTYDARLVEEEVNADGTAGRKTLEQVVIPRHAGVTELPALRLSFFDPEKGRYETLVQGPFPLRVQPSANAIGELVGVTGVDGIGTPAARILGEDLVFLKSSPGRLEPIADYPTGRFLGLGAVPLGLWALTASLLSRQRRREADPMARRNRQAPARLRKALGDLEAHRGDARAFHDALWRILTQYLGDRLGLPPGEIEPARIGDRLSAESQREVSLWFDRCARVRFGGSASDFDGQALQKDFTAFMRRLNGELGA